MQGKTRFTNGSVSLNYLIKMHYLYTQTMQLAHKGSGFTLPKLYFQGSNYNIRYKNASAVTRVVQHLQLL